MKHDVDAYVGQRIRYRRGVIGMTQQQLADQVGIKFQQIQKYETGKNRVSASRLWDIAQSVDVGVTFFFDGLVQDDEGGIVDDVFASKEAMQLVRAYYAMPETQRRQMFILVHVLSDTNCKNSQVTSHSL